jgi:hypothetical protein
MVVNDSNPVRSLCNMVTNRRAWLCLLQVAINVKEKKPKTDRSCGGSRNTDVCACSLANADEA